MLWGVRQGPPVSASLVNKNSVQQILNFVGTTVAKLIKNDEKSPWPHAELEHTLIIILGRLYEYQAAFSNAIPVSFLPRRPHNKPFIMLPIKLPA